MRKSRTAAALLLAVAALTTPVGAVELNDRTYTQIRDHIRPKQAELNWQEIPWRSTFWSAVVEAQKRDKPVLAWAMNGHPLACT